MDVVQAMLELAARARRRRGRRPRLRRRPHRDRGGAPRRRARPVRRHRSAAHRRGARNARAAGVAERIRFVNQDLFAADLRGVTVVMLFLSRAASTCELRPKLAARARAGRARGLALARHGRLAAERAPCACASDGRERPVYLWHVKLAHGSRRNRNRAEPGRRGDLAARPGRRRPRLRADRARAAPAASRCASSSRTRRSAPVTINQGMRMRAWYDIFQFGGGPGGRGRHPRVAEAGREADRSGEKGTRRSSSPASRRAARSCCRPRCAIPSGSPA